MIFGRGPFYQGSLPLCVYEGDVYMKNNRFVAAVLVPGFLFLLIFSIFPVVYGLGISLYDYNPANI